MLLIDFILKICKNEFINNNNDKQCQNCSHPAKCPGSCEKCLKQIHFSSYDESARHSYNCQILSDYYVCKYSLKYASEMMYALDGLKEIDNVEKLKILSIGCGPCTDLFAVDALRENDYYGFEKLRYIGVDLLYESWGLVHKDIKKYYVNDDDTKIKFIYDNINNVLCNLDKKSNLIILNYFLSDFCKYGDKKDIKLFVDNLIEYIRYCQNPVIVINDVNLDCSRGGGRDYFDIIYNKLNTYGFTCEKRHFNNSNKDRHYAYGNEYKSNHLAFNDNRIAEYMSFNPYETCSSAQIIISR